MEVSTKRYFKVKNALASGAQLTGPIFLQSNFKKLLTPLISLLKKGVLYFQKLSESLS